ARRRRHPSRQALPRPRRASDLARRGAGLDRPRRPQGARVGNGARGARRNGVKPAAAIAVPTCVEREEPMSQAEVALIQSLYAAFGRGEIATIVAAVTPDIEWRLNGSRSDHPLLGTWNGPKGVQAFFDELARLQDFSEFTPREFLFAGGRVFVL